MLAEFGYFGGDDELAVGLLGVAGVVFLVVFLGGVESRQGRNFGDDGIGPEFFRHQLSDDLPGDGFLFRGVVKNDRTVLRTDISALTVKRGGGMNGEENLQEPAYLN